MGIHAARVGALCRSRLARLGGADHRASALLTVAGARAAAYHVYFPHHRINEGLQPYTVTDWFLLSSHEPNCKVGITEVAQLKFEAGCQHVSQFGKGNLKYTHSVMDAEDRTRIRERRI